jgi:outer membrane protein assembly factor BamB
MHRFIGLVALIVTAVAADWPRFLGPAGDGHSPESGLLKAWPAEGPTKLWERPVGSGYAGPAVTGGKVILFHRVEAEEVAECLDAQTGKTLWKQGSPTGYVDEFNFDDGPRGVPAIAGEHVYTLGAEGRLICRKLAEGAKVWEHDLQTDYQFPKGYFGVGVSPLVEGDGVFVNVGAKGAGVVAFDRATGKELWKVSDDGPSYSTPVAADIGGKRRLVFFTRQGLLVLDPKTGEIVHQMRYRARIDASVNAATPLVADGKIFLSACYGVGGLLIDTEGWKPIWKKDESMSSHYTTSVKVGEYLYGSHGRQEEGASLRCVAWKTGEVKWTKEGIGCAWLIAADGMLIAVQESGEIALLEASPEGYREKGRFTAFAKSTDRGKLLRSAPALADGVLYVRDAQKLAAWRVGK